MEWEISGMINRGIPKIVDECTYPNCGDCSGDRYCVRNSQKSSKLPPKKRDRSEYYKKYNDEHKASKKAYYQSKKMYLSYVTVKKEINGLRKQIGDVNYKLVMEAIEQIDKELVK